MKQLELNVTIKHIGNSYEIISRPINASTDELYTYCCGDTLKEALGRLWLGLSDENTRYWFVLKDK